MKTTFAKTAADKGVRKSRKLSIIVMGGSAGAFHPLKQIISELPADLPAAVFVVLHIEPERKSMLAELFGRDARIEVVEAADGLRIVAGKVYVAVPDFHLRIAKDQVLLDHGPRHNFSRPAIDPLFTSAAQAFGRAVIGVILSGALDDGTAGLMDVKRAGGITIVQNPAEAVNPSMPTSALDCVEIDYRVPVDKIAKLLVQISGKDTPGKIRKGAGRMRGAPTPKLSTHICPECNGPMWFTEDGKLLHFRCRIGHSFSGQSLLVEKSKALESALWSAVNALKDKADICGKLAGRSTATRGSNESKIHFVDQATRSVANAKIIEEILLGENSAVPLTRKESSAVDA